ILPGRRSHQMSVHNQNISVTVNLKKLDGPSHHICQGRLFGSCCNFVGKRQIISCKKSEEAWLLPSCDLFELGQIVNDANPCLIQLLDRKSTRLNSSHVAISYAVFCLKKKKNIRRAAQYENRQIHCWDNTV